MIKKNSITFHINDKNKHYYNDDNYKEIYNKYFCSCIDKLFPIPILLIRLYNNIVLVDLNKHKIKK
jgi:hypothetical protein